MYAVHSHAQTHPAHRHPPTVESLPPPRALPPLALHLFARLRPPARLRRSFHEQHLGSQLFHSRSPFTVPFFLTSPRLRTRHRRRRLFGLALGRVSPNLSPRAVFRSALQPGVNPASKDTASGSGLPQSTSLPRALRIDDAARSCAVGLLLDSASTHVLKHDIACATSGFFLSATLKREPSSTCSLRIWATPHGQATAAT